MYTSTASQHCNIINIMNVNASCLSLFVNRTACAHDEDEIIKILDSNSVGWRVCIEDQPTQQPTNSATSHPQQTPYPTPQPTPVCEYSLYVDDGSGVIYQQHDIIGYIYSFAGRGSGEMRCSVFDGSMACVGRDDEYYTAALDGNIPFSDIVVNISSGSVHGSTALNVVCPAVVHVDKRPQPTPTPEVCSAVSVDYDISVVDGVSQLDVFDVDGETKLYSYMGRTMNEYYRNLSLSCTVSNAYDAVGLSSLYLSDYEYVDRIKGMLVCKSTYVYFYLYILDDNRWEYGAHASMRLDLADDNSRLSVHVEFDESPCDMHNNEFWCRSNLMAVDVTNPDKYGINFVRNEIALCQVNYAFEHGDTYIKKLSFSAEFNSGGMPSRICENGYEYDVDETCNCFRDVMYYDVRADCVGKDDGFECTVAGESTPVIVAEGPQYFPDNYHFTAEFRLYTMLLSGMDYDKYYCSTADPLITMKTAPYFFFEGKCPTSDYVPKVIIPAPTSTPLPVCLYEESNKLLRGYQGYFDSSIPYSDPVDIAQTEMRWANNTYIEDGVYDVECIWLSDLQYVCISAAEGKAMFFNNLIAQYSPFKEGDSFSGAWEFRNDDGLESVFRGTHKFQGVCNPLPEGAPLPTIAPSPTPEPTVAIVIDPTPPADYCVVGSTIDDNPNHLVGSSPGSDERVVLCESEFRWCNESSIEEGAHSSECTFTTDDSYRCVSGGKCMYEVKILKSQNHWSAGYSFSSTVEYSECSSASYINQTYTVYSTLHYIGNCKPF